uniref:Photosystem II reaction center protein Psb30 n=1 Tax=Synarthrophyton chejuense TaxID=2485825 RepID=A0A3G3MFN2_9FLOR|nr:photosystem II protein psb30 [Synarthrophyton chejuense]AYR05628.1 photosystem II protein psb30 [Synarthrophyton chejuense]
MINWQVIGQLISLTIIVLLGPAVIVVLSFKRGNL